MRFKSSEEPERDLPMGNHITNVTNKFGKHLDLVVRHPNGKCEILNAKDQETRTILTGSGNVTISVFDPDDSVQKEIPLESKTIPSNKSVVLEKDVHGTLRIRRSRSLCKYESRKKIHIKLAAV